MVLKSVRFSSYKKFAGHEELEIRPVTILVGKNSSGKSSITKLFPYFRRALSGAAINGPLSYQNDNVALGGVFVDVSHNGMYQGLQMGVSFDDMTSIDMELFSADGTTALANKYTLGYNGKTYVLKLDLPDSLMYNSAQLEERLSASELSGFIHRGLFRKIGLQDATLAQKIDYIGPLRAAPKSMYTNDSSVVIEHTGKDGENAYMMLFRDEVLLHKVSEWFGQTFGGIRLDVDKLPEPNSFRILLYKSYSGKFGINISNEGMGISQVLPIVVRSLYKEKDSIVVVEQPELHLHPAAHGSLAKLFAQTAIENGQRYVIETHSKNILLGVREAVVDKSNPITADDVIVYFIDEDENGAYLKKITIGTDGVLSDWPTGVWEEATEQTKNIRRLATV